MINKIISQYFLEFTGINEAIHTKEKSKKVRYIGISLAIVYAVVTMMALYSFQLYQILKILKPYQMEIELLTLGVVSTLIFSLIGSWLKSANILFLSSDLSFWLSCPIPRRTLVLGKSITAYIFELVPALGFMIPPIILVGNALQMDWDFYVLGILGTVFIPIPAFILGTGLGVLTQILFKGISTRKSFLKTVVAFAFTIGVVILSFKIETIDWQGLGQQIVGYLAVAKWIELISSHYINLVLNSSWLGTGLYFIIHLVIMGAFILLISQRYEYILNLFNPVQRGKKSAKISYKENSPFLTLYKRELRRYFSTSSYVLNTMFSEVMLVIFTLIILINQESALGIVNSIGMHFGLSNVSMSMVGIAISLLMATSCTTAASISLEGRQLPLLKSFPISVMTIYHAKIGVNLTICLLALMICLPVLFWILPFTLIEVFLTIWLTVGYSVFISIFGLVVNLKFPVFNWQTEVTVIKQSVASFIAVFIGMFSVVGPVFIGINFLPLEMDELVFLIATIITLINLGLYMLLKTMGIKWFENL